MQKHPSHAVLIVEDDQDLANLLSKQLQTSGFQTTLVKNGADAITLVEESPQQFILLLDYELPDMTAKDVIETLVNKRHSLPFVVMTAHGSEQIAVDMMKLGARDYLIKNHEFTRTLSVTLEKVSKQLETEVQLRETEKALRSVEESLYNIIYESADGIIVLDVQGIIKYANPAAEIILGRSQKNLRGKPFGFVVNSGQSTEIEIPHPNGQVITAEIRTVESEWEGQPALVLSIRDITERRKSAQKLAEREKRLRDLFQFSPDAILVKDLEGKILAANSTAGRLHGIEPEDLIGMRWIDVAPEEHKVEAKVLFSKLTSGESDFIEGRIWTSDNRSVPVEIRANYFDYEGHPALLLHVRDVTERWRAKKELSRSEAKYRTLFNKIADPIFIIDKETSCFLDCNESAVQVYGYSLAEIKTMTPFDLHHEKDQVQRQPKVPIEDKLSTYTHVTKAGKTMFVEVLSDDIDYQGRSARISVVRDITERQKSSEKLRLQGAALQSAANAILITDCEGKIEWVNHAFTKLTGYGFDEVVGQLPNLLKSSKHDEDFYKNIWQTILSGKVWQGEIINRHKKGHLYTEEMTITPVSGEAGEIKHFVAIKLDITTRKKLEKQIEEMALFAELDPSPVLRFDETGRILAANHSAFEVFGKAVKKAKPLKSVLPEIKQIDLESCIRQRSIVKLEATVNRRLFDFVIQGISEFGYGHIYGIDITERREAENELLQAHRETEQLLASISSILIGINRDNRITHWNAAATKAFGLNGKKMIGKPIAECPIQESWAELAKWAGAEMEQPQKSPLDDIRYTRADDSEGFLRMTIHPIRIDGQTNSGYLLLADDITDRKILESQLAQAQKLESIGQLASGIAHEINTPIQYVGHNTKFLLDAFEDLGTLFKKYRELLISSNNTPLVDTLVNELEKEASDIDVDYLLQESPVAIKQTLEGIDRVSEIVKAMKAFSHPGSDKKTLVDINQALWSTITVARNEWKYVAEMETDLDPSLPQVPCLPGEINQVFLNMIINAAHAICEAHNDSTDEKGVIRIKTYQSNNHVTIEISDNGTGIPESAKSKIFDPFFTTKEVGKGTGQGLAISYNVVVEKHQGTLSFETELGKGTTFIITLPTKHSQ